MIYTGRVMVKDIMGHSEISRQKATQAPLRTTLIPTQTIQNTSGTNIPLDTTHLWGKTIRDYNKSHQLKN